MTPEKFWSRTEAMPNGCIEWRWAITHDGYGECRLNGKPIRAHRVIWILMNGPIPDGLWVLHKCDNRPCVNLEHLFLGTALDNNRDMVMKGRCNPGHVFGEASNFAKLNEAQVREILSLRDSGESCRSVGKRYGVTHDAIWKIWRGLSWTQLEKAA